LSATSEVSVDATGLETHYASRYFIDRRTRPGRTCRLRHYFKLTVVVDHRSHLILSAVVSRGPSNDAPGFLPAVEQAAMHTRIRRLFGDAAYDAEEHHRRCRKDWKIPETITPINHRGRPKAKARGRYRREMQRNFPAEKYGRRWHVESVFSRAKRRLTPNLHARNNASRANQCLLLVITHNLMLLAQRRKKISTEQLEA
jgi:hypothetical protein